MGTPYLGHDVLQLTAGLVGAIVIAEAVHHLLVLELVLVRNWRDRTQGDGDARTPPRPS